jgi:aryl-alcohol dehydrogenase-like predicted oxidoreductase
MEYSRFGRTDLIVSRLCLGTAPFGKQTEEKLANEILDKATEAGISFLDTANVYPMGAEDSLVGRTEEIIGRWLKGKRNRFIIATKAGGKMGPAAWDQGSSRSHLLNAIDASLQRLGTDYVDLYQLHFDDPKTPLDETLEALSMIVRSGTSASLKRLKSFARWQARSVLRLRPWRLPGFFHIHRLPP